MPEFDVSVVTTRSGMHIIRIAATTATEALRMIEAEYSSGQCHCPAEACTDDRYSSVVGARQVASSDAVVVYATQHESEQASRG